MTNGLSNGIFKLMEKTEKEIKENDELVKKLRAYMEKHGLKAYELAQHLETTEGNVSRWLRKKHIIGSAWQKLMKIKLNLKD